MDLVPLSPIDHVFTGRGAYPIEFVFAYGGALDAAGLEDTLRRTLAAFPPASSRIVARPDGALAFEPCDDGCVFSVAASDLRFDDTEDRAAFLDPVDTAVGQPVTRIRLTRTPAGDVLGVSLSHAVADGFGYFHFLSSWSRVFRCEPFLPPSHARGLLLPRAGLPPEASPDGPDAPNPPAAPAVPLAAQAAGTAAAAVAPDAATLAADAGLFLDAPRKALARGALRWERHLLRREDLDELLLEARRGAPDAGGGRLSHNDAVAAWLWLTYVASWTAADGPGTTYLSAPVDHRRLLPGFPPAYFGNAVVLASAAIERGDLCRAPLGALAARVRAAVDGVDEPRVRRALHGVDALRRAGGLAALEACHVVHPRRGLLVTNLSRLPVPEIAFDAGPPVAFDILTPAERGAVVLPAPGGGVDVRVCLPVTRP